MSQKIKHDFYTTFLLNNCKFSLRIPDVIKFQDKSPYKEIRINLNPYIKALHENPWKARSITEILNDIKSGAYRLTHSKRVQNTDLFPIGVVQLPRELFKVRKYRYEVIDGWHRIMKAIIQDKKTIKARLYDAEWNKKVIK